LTPSLQKEALNDHMQVLTPRRDFTAGQLTSYAVLDTQLQFERVF
jgi:hypothetical protein